MKTLNVTEAAKVLGIHENSVRRWADRGDIPHYRIGPRGDRRFVQAELEAWLQSQRVQASPTPLSEWSFRQIGKRA